MKFERYLKCILLQYQYFKNCNAMCQIVVKVSQKKPRTVYIKNTLFSEILH